MFALRRALVGTAAAPVRCRAFCSTPPAGGKSPWLADKSVSSLVEVNGRVCSCINPSECAPFHYLTISWLIYAPSLPPKYRCTRSWASLL